MRSIQEMGVNATKNVAVCAGRTGAIGRFVLENADLAFVAGLQALGRVVGLNERSGIAGIGWNASLQGLRSPIPKWLKQIGIPMLSLAFTLPVQAFDASKVPNGLYYNGTDVNQQMWTPLLLAQDGKLIDPLLYAQANGIKALEGQGKTTLLLANSPFLYGGCPTETQLGSVVPVIANVPTVYVLGFGGAECGQDNVSALANFQHPLDQQADNPMPTLLVKQPRPGSPPLWIYGVPGMLAGKNLPVRTWSEDELGGTPKPINGVISRSHFVTLPVLEPDERKIARIEKRPRLKYGVNLLEAGHRSNKVVVDAPLHQTATTLLKEKLWPRYYPRLQAALAQRFGGIAESYFELGLMQGVDIDNTRAFDYVGVARIGIVTRAGPWRWVDVVWCWRSALGQSEEALQVLRTSEDALYEPANHYFSDKHPSLWSPNLVVSGFADFDKDKRMEVISTLVRPVGVAYDKVSPESGGSYELWLRDSAIHAWLPDPTDARKGAWQKAFNSAVHEERIVTLRPAQMNIELFGE